MKYLNSEDCRGVQYRQKLKTISRYFLGFYPYFAVCYCAGILRTRQLTRKVFDILCGGQFTLIDINLFQQV